MPMTDPYKVLGIPTTATDDEVKQAYRRLAKRYHPDANPGDKAAEQRMKEINAAYDHIINGDTGGAGSAGGYESYGGYGGYGGYGYGGYESRSADPRMNAARTYIQFGRYHEALNVLAGIRERDALWYYYSAVANRGLNNRIAAIQHAQKAVEMEGDNAAYRALLADALAGGFGLLLALKIVLALSVAGHFIVAMSLRRRGRLVSSVSRRLHLSLFWHMVGIVLLAKLMFHLG